VFLDFLIILVMAIGGRPQPELCFLPGRACNQLGTPGGRRVFWGEPKFF